MEDQRNGYVYFSCFFSINSSFYTDCNVCLLRLSITTKISLVNEEIPRRAYNRTRQSAAANVRRAIVNSLFCDLSSLDYV